MFPAFDRVPFDGMLRKCEAHGIAGQLLKWLRNWTENQRQRVVLNGVNSNSVDVLSSVVQGSVLGPILFLIYINDLDAAVMSDDRNIYISKFADDTKIGREITCITDTAVVQGSVPGPVLFLIYINCIDLAVRAHDSAIVVSKFADDTKLGRKISDLSDQKSLQTALRSLNQWCDEWGMQLHPDKCLVIHFGKNNPEYDYHIGQTVLTKVNGERDLGIFITKECDPSQHVDNIARKGHVILSQLRRATTLRDSHTFAQLYKVYVRPLLEAAAPVWNPSKRESVHSLEKVQRRALRMISDLGSLSYEERLDALGLESLEDRRERGDLIQCYKTMHEHGGIKPDDWFSFVRDRHDVNTRSSAANYIVPEKCNRNVRKNFYLNRVTHIWNKLPEEVKVASSTNSFKNLYDSWKCN